MIERNVPVTFELQEGQKEIIEEVCALFKISFEDAIRISMMHEAVLNMRCPEYRRKPVQHTIHLSAREKKILDMSKAHTECRTEDFIEWANIFGEHSYLPDEIKYRTMHLNIPACAVTDGSDPINEEQFLCSIEDKVLIARLEKEGV